MNHIVVLEVKFNFGNQENKIYPVILEDEKEMVLIDCGYPNFLEVIYATALYQGVNINKLSKIIITHHDYDHLGALADFKRKYSNIDILASKEDTPYIEGKFKSLRLRQAEKLYDTLTEEEKVGADQFHRMLESVESCNVDVMLEDKEYLDICGGIEIIATPGHMPGHISIYHKASKSLITGDALVIENGKLVIALPQYTLDMEEAVHSVKKFLNYDIEKIICYHGGVYEGRIKESLEEIKILF